GNHPGGDTMILDRGEQAGLTEFARERCFGFLRWSRFQGVNLPGVIDEIDFTVAIGAEADDLQARQRQVLAPGDLAVFLLQPPHLASGIVAVDIRAREILELLPSIDKPSGDGARLGMRMFDEWFEERSRSAFAVELKRMRAFHHAPAVVSAF